MNFDLEEPIIWSLPSHVASGLVLVLNSPAKQRRRATPAA